MNVDKKKLAKGLMYLALALVVVNTVLLVGWKRDDNLLYWIGILAYSASLLLEEQLKKEAKEED